MCGIAGIIYFDESRKVIPSDIKIMTDVIEHRGPDDQGFIINKNVGLGHRRLSILDLSSAGHQPMSFSHLEITYNGEIYNYLEIREELINNGYSFSSNTDTEVILKAYDFYGENCVNKFNGMWSFAIFNKKTNTVFLSRDRFGIKPLYYFLNQDVFIFASEIKQILPLLDKVEVNKSRLYDYLYFSILNHTSETFYKNIYSLQPSHNLIVNLDEKEILINRYYTIEKQKELENISEKESIDLFKKAFDKSIQLRLRSDVKVGTCLSGGLDSSYVSKVASNNYRHKDKFTAVTAKSSDKSNDESEYARKVVEKYNLNWKVINPSREDFIRVMDDVIYFQEEPFVNPSTVMQYFVMEKAKKEGCKVMLDGQGGDEVLLGYERYYVPFLRQSTSFRKFFGSFRTIAKHSKLSSFKLILYYIFFNFPKIRLRLLGNRNKFILEKNKKYFSKRTILKYDISKMSIFELQKEELFFMQLPKLLKFEDRNSMAHSIEARVPFLDHKLVELALSLPLD